MAKYMVSIDKSGCISDAICTAICSNWYMGADGKANYRKEIIDESEYEENHEAEISCPTSVIKVQPVAD
ncbi:MAG: ferredoxin [Candidatus Thermoplasmatota archaeon]|nr:ferredoxin [Candidatus Thermoplasmatota archaeon]MCL6089976.1 ferredoxin [Candidatus Thermoplasmatota archaeon]MDA8143150.1 ferredoxin [Thermoplasmatales archaeon]